MTPTVQELLAKVPTDLLIDGAWRPGSTGETLTVDNPATGEKIATVASATSADAVAALDAAVAAQAEWARTAPRERAEILRRAFREAGVLEKGDSDSTRVPITKADLYRLGLSGGENSAEKRRMLLRQLSLPGRLGTNALPAVLSRLLSLEELEMLVSHLSGPSDEPRK